MIPREKLLPRLEGLKSAGLQQWKARCPAHDDRDPSLCVREVDDGTLLVKCWAGCSADEICAAIGLGLRDLFVSRGGQDRKPSVSAKDRLLERMVVQIGTALLSSGCMLSGEDQKRLDLAKQRLGGGHGRPDSR